MWIVLVGLALGGIAIAGGGKPVGGAVKGFEIAEGCTKLVVSNEAAAFAWIRKHVASLGANWQKQLLLDTLGMSCAMKLAQDPNVLQSWLPQLPFIWKLLLHALAGAVDSGKISREEAEKRIVDIIDKAPGWGLDPALLTPTTLP